MALIVSYTCVCLFVFQELPSSIGRLKRMTNFNVDRNRLTEIPVDVSSLIINSGASCLSEQSQQLSASPKSFKQGTSQNRW